ncbi:hypothetical protein PFISCL1PPCAC_3896, partial [Pristionchus fissidentatus]
RVVELENGKSGEKEVKVAHSLVAESDNEESDEEEEEKKEQDEESDEEEEEVCDTVPSIDPLSVLIPYKGKSGIIHDVNLSVSKVQQELDRLSIEGRTTLMRDVFNRKHYLQCEMCKTENFDVSQFFRHISSKNHLKALPQLISRREERN